MCIRDRGTGAQGSTVAQRMDEEANVEKIICADADHKAVDELVKILKKAEGAYVDADDVESIKNCLLYTSRCV